MAFTLDDIVTIKPADKLHPATAGNGYGRIVGVNANGDPKMYQVGVGDIVGFVYVMNEVDLVANTGPVSNRLVASLPAKKTTSGKR